MSEGRSGLSVLGSDFSFAFDGKETHCIPGGGSWWIAVTKRKVPYPWKEEPPQVRMGTCSEGLKRSLSKLCSSRSRFSLWTLSLHRSLSTVR